MEELIRETYRGIFEKELIDEIISVAKIVEFKEGDVLIDIGKYIKTMPLRISGAIKIMREDFGIGELFLYFIEKDDTCSMTLNCCMCDKKNETRAMAENNGLVAMIPVCKMEEWLGKYKRWHAFVF